MRKWLVAGGMVVQGAALISMAVTSGFAAWFVADARIHCRINRAWTASGGVDNAQADSSQRSTNDRWR